MSAYSRIQSMITAVKIYLVVMNVDVDLDSDYMAGMYPSYYLKGTWIYYPTRNKVSIGIYVLLFQIKEIL